MCTKRVYQWGVTQIHTPLSPAGTADCPSNGVNCGEYRCTYGISSFFPGDAISPPWGGFIRLYRQPGLRNESPRETQSSTFCPQSGWQDLNLRLSIPKTDTLPSCATPCLSHFPRGETTGVAATCTTGGIAHLRAPEQTVTPGHILICAEFGGVETVGNGLLHPFAGVGGLRIPRTRRPRVDNLPAPQLIILPHYLDLSTPHAVPLGEPQKGGDFNRGWMAAAPRPRRGKGDGVRCAHQHGHRQVGGCCLPNGGKCQFVRGGCADAQGELVVLSSHFTPSSLLTPKI